jgi:hypothetical protein
MGRPIYFVPSLAPYFASVDWFVPAYISIGAMSEFVVDLKAAPAIGDHEKVLAAHLRRWYGREALAAMLLYRYRVTPHVLDFKSPIAEAIEGAQLGLFHAAVTTLIPPLEGILRSFGATFGVKTGIKKHMFVRVIDAVIARQQQSLASSPYANDPAFQGTVKERVIMLTAQRDFFDGKLYANTAKVQNFFDGKLYANTAKVQKGLNRHGILHGLFLDFGDELNFHKLLGFLDLLCFFIALGMSGISTLAPGRTAASAALAQYYEALRRVSAVAAKVGAR